MSSYDFWNFKLKDTVSHSVSVVVLGQALEAPPTSHKLQAHQVSKDVLQWPQFTQSCGELVTLDLEFKHSRQPRKVRTVNGSSRWLPSF